MTANQSSIKIHVLQIAYDDTEDMDSRVDRVAALVRGQEAADLVVLPELWAHGGFSYARWGQDAQRLDGHVVAELSAAARDAGVYLHGGSIAEHAADGADLGPQGRGLWNTSVLFEPGGELTATYRKIHRFGFGEGEPVLMEAGTDVVTTAMLGETLGLATCYDLRFPELFRQLLDRGAGIFLVPAAWPKPRIEQWSLLGRARALENQCYMVQCNTAGSHGGVVMGGRSQVVAPDGVVLAQAGDDEEVLVVELDLARIPELRERFPVLADRRL